MTDVMRKNQGLVTSPGGGLLDELRFNTNQKREYDRLVREISARENMSPETLAKEFRPVLMSERTGTQKVDAILKLLREKRSPELSARMETFNRLKQELGCRRHGIEVDPPKNFDGSRFHFLFSASSADDVRSAGRTLAKMADDSRLTEIFKLLT